MSTALSIPYMSIILLRSKYEPERGEILPVNIMFRAVAVPEGEHTVVFEFRPPSVRLGAWVSGGALIILSIGLISAGIRGYRKS